jgi:hypothetical protein
MLLDMNMRDVSAPYRAAKTRLIKARQQLAAATDFARKTGLTMLEQGATEVEVAEALGVNRLTVRKWQGK